MAKVQKDGAATESNNKGPKKVTNEIGTYRLDHYKGNPMVVLNTGNERFPLQLGKRKVHTILANLKALKAFAHDNPMDSDGDE